MKPITLTLTLASSDIVYISCKEAGIDQEFLVEDVPALLRDLPNLINPPTL